jgi:glycosyltransferase involved in cell wall biosynthesis
VIRLLFANNYDMARARAGWRRGTYPAHHLFGTAYLDAPFDVLDIRYRDDDLPARMTRRLRGSAGDIGLQMRAVAHLRRRAIVYAAQAQEVTAVAAFRRAGLIRAPVVGVFHGVGSGGRLNRFPLGGFDHAIALSQMTRRALTDGGIPPDRVSTLAWGPDLEFPGFASSAAPSADARLVSTGKTGRDLETLIAALRLTGQPARIYADRRALAGDSPIPDRVEIVPPVPPRPPTNAPFTYEHTLADLRSAGVIAIPLKDRHPLHGLTELADAIACARPVIVTRAPYFDLDVEAIGCGWWVDHGDIDGWAAAITEAFSDRTRLAEMGRAGRRWAGEHWNARRFADSLREVLLDVAEGLGPQDAAGSEGRI